MSTYQIENIVSTLLSAPVKAATYANKEQLQIWRDYLETVQKLTSQLEGGAKLETIQHYINMAPAWKVAANLDIGITMRIASITKTTAGGSLSLTLGLLQSAGQFSTESTTTSESVLTAKAHYVLTNDTEVKLAEFLKSLGVSPTQPEQLQTAVAQLSKLSSNQAG